MSRNKSNMFNSLEVLQFAYKSMFALLSLNYLNKEFESLSELFSMGYQEVREKYSEELTELEDEMKFIGEQGKLTVMQNFARIYQRKLAKEIIGDNMSMEV